MDSHRRTLAKTLSYRFFGTIATAGVAWIFTGRLALGVTIGVIDSLAKMGIYYFHERFWARIPHRDRAGQEGDGI
jgi:adenylylsulfate kinase